MYEAIIAAVGAVLAGIFPAMIHERKRTVRDLEIRMEMLERSLGVEMRRSGAKCNELCMNQAMQLFFETLKSLDVQIRIKPSQNDNMILNISNFPARSEFEPMLKIAAQDVLDFETSKTVFEMVGLPATQGGKTVLQDCRDVCEIQSASQIMQRSRNRLNQRLSGSHLSGGKL